MGELFVYSLFFGALFTFFPIFIYIDAYVDVKKNKYCFSLSIYKYLKLYGGYFKFHRDGIAFHLTDKKAVILQYDKMMDTRKKFEVTKGFQLFRFHQVVETGGVNAPTGALIAGFLQATSGVVFSVLQTRHPFLSLKSSTLLTEENDLKVTLQTALIFNGLLLSVAFGKKLLEALINWIRKKRSIALWKKRQNS